MPVTRCHPEELRDEGAAVLWRVVHAILTGLLAAAAGCYSYVAPATGTALTGRETQLQLTDSGAVVLASTIGPSASAIIGRLVADTGSIYVMSLTSVRQRGGEETGWRGEHVAVPHALVMSADTRRFSISRTALFSSVVSAGLIAARQAFHGLGTGGGGGGIGRSGQPR